MAAIGRMMIKGINALVDAKRASSVNNAIKLVNENVLVSVICSHVAMACGILLIVVMIAFLLKYRKTMQAMLAAFPQMNTKNTGTQSVQADQIGRTYPPLFTLNLPKEDEIIDDLREITAMEYVVQVIMIIVCKAVVIIVMHFCCTKCRHTHSIIHTSRHTDLFVEVTNITKGNGIWADFASTGCFPSQIQISRQIQKEDVQIETFCCIFKCIRINWSSIIVTGISGTMITVPDIAYVSIFMDNDLTNITEDHFDIKLIARLLDQIHVIQPPMLPPRYDDTPPGEYEYSQPHTSTDGKRPLAPQFPEHLHSLLTHL